MVSTLRVSYLQLIETVSEFLGTGFAPYGDNMTRVRRIIRDGYGHFMYPPIVPPDRLPHRWSFLYPNATCTLTSGTYTVDLPVDFLTLAGDVTYALGEMTYDKLRVVSEQRIRELRQQNDTSGDPYAVAVRLLSNTAASGPLRQFVFYPTPSRARTLYYRYQRSVDQLDDTLLSGTCTITGATSATLTDTGSITAAVAQGDLVIISSGSPETLDSLQTVASTTVPDTITLTPGCSENGTANYEVVDANIYPLCGPEHMNTLIEACLKIAELRYDDNPGDHARQFMECLAASIRLDRMNGPASLGMNLDTGLGRHSVDRQGDIYYNGTLMTE